MTGGNKHFYARGNTAHGFANLFESSLQQLEHLYILIGAPGTGKSTMIQTIGEQMETRGYEIWCIHSPSENGSLDGVIIPELKVGIVVNGCVTETDLTEGIVHHVNVDDARDLSAISVQQEAIDSLTASIAQTYDLAYSGFAEALLIHDGWEALYISSMNFQAADELTNEYMHQFYGNQQLTKQSRIDHRFLGAATARGAVDHVPNLTAGLTRYLVKGRAGSGKSTLLKKIAASGAERGFDIEMYHCGFDPNSLDMVIVRELGFAIFDSTAPHEYFPDRPTDEIIDMYERCITPGTDELHATEISSFKEQYAAKMKASTQYLTDAKSLQDERKQLYIQTVDYAIVDRLREEVQQEIDRIAATMVMAE